MQLYVKIEFNILICIIYSFLMWIYVAFNLTAALNKKNDHVRYTNDSTSQEAFDWTKYYRQPQHGKGRLKL